MEPERDIEKDLKAYAQKRRDAAGTPPGLHPANRKALQQEAARLANSPSPETRSAWQILLGSWPRLAIAGVALIALVSVTWMLLPQSKLRNEEFQLKQEMARNEPETSKVLPADRLALPPPAEMPAPVPEPKKARVVSPRAKEQAKSDSSFVQTVNGRREVTGAVAASTPPPSAAPAPVSTVSIGGASIATATRKSALSKDSEFDLFDSKKKPEGSSANRSLGLTSQAQDGISPEEQSPAVIQSFLRTASPLKAEADKGGEFPASSNVLASFRVEQTLDRLRMIDRDGSVYLGFVTKTSAEGAQYAKALEKTDQLKNSPRFYRFRVSGTNRTLNKEVVFTGDFLNKAIPPPGQPAVFFGGAVSGTITPTASDDTAPLELHGALLDGRLLVGGTNSIEIHAAPAKP